MLTRRKGKRLGFTLIETVVTVGIIATLAAVVIPQVVRQFDAADPARVQQDLKNLQTGIETFNVNTSAFPGDLDDLVNEIASDNSDSTLSTLAAALPVFTAEMVTSWKGPYADVSFVHLDSPTAESDLTTGYGAAILDSFVCYNADDNTHGESAGVSGAGATDDQACANAVGQKFLAIQITGLATSETDPNFIALNKLFDDDVAEELSTGRETLGRVRFDGTSDVVFFLASPMT
jgi:prepilin-type N-terminal cleavage/methylation domain-containing protein